MCETHSATEDTLVKLKRIHMHYIQSCHVEPIVISKNWIDTELNGNTFELIASCFSVNRTMPTSQFSYSVESIV